jgi:DNA-binding transcriptional LysR family regulator
MTVPILPSIKGLQALATLARHGSLDSAASGLGVTRSALSHRIADLEAQLGVALLRKDGRRSVLTDDAQVLLAALGDSLDRIAAAVQPLRRRRTQVRLSTVATFASHWLIPRLPEFRRRHPDAEVAISTTVRAVDLATEDFDCAIRHGLGVWDGLTATLLFHETLMPVAAPAIADGVTDALGRVHFETAPLIQARSRFLDWPVWWRFSGRAGSAPSGAVEVETRAQAMEAALAGAGIAMMDMAYLDRAVADGRLRQLAARPVRLSEGYYFVHRQGAGTGRIVAALRDWLVEAASPYRGDAG